MGRLAPWHPLYALVLVAIAVPATLRIEGVSSTKTLVLLLALALGLAAYVANREWMRQARPDLRPSLVLCLPILIATAANPDVIRSSTFRAPGTGLLLVLAFLAPLALACGRRHPAAIGRSADLMLAVSPIVAAIAAVQVGLDEWPLLDGSATTFDFTSDRHPGRAAGTFGHPAIYGAFAGAMVVLALIRRRPYWQLFVTVNAIGLALSGARSAWVAVAVAVIVHALRSRLVPGYRALAWAALVVAAAGLVSFAVAGGSFRNLSHRFEAAPAAFSDRNEVLEGGWDRIFSGPGAFLVGSGPGTAQRLFTEEGFMVPGQPLTFDNTYVTIWFELGILGLLAVVALMAVAVLRAGQPEHRALAVFLAINVLTYDAFHWPVVSVLGLLLFGSSRGARGASDSSTSGSAADPIEQAPGALQPAP